MNESGAAAGIAAAFFLCRFPRAEYSLERILALSQFLEDRFPEDDSIFVVSNEK
jgi:hypothetical protein